MGIYNTPLGLGVYVCSKNSLATLAIERLLAQSHSDWHLATWFPNQLISVPPGTHILLIDISSISESEWPEIVHSWTEAGHRTILMTGESWASRSVALRALHLGVRGVVCISADFIQQLLEAIRSVAKGQLFADEKILEEFYYGYRRKPSPSSIPYLSFREEQVIDLLTKGFSNKRIGAVLGITERTAKFHVCNLLRKLQVRTRRELVDRYVFNQHKSTSA